MERATRTLPSAMFLALALTAAAGADNKAPDPEVNFNAGLTHLRENRVALALEEFKKAVRADGKNPYFAKGLGVAYTQLGRYSEAIAAFRKALELNPYYVDVRNDLGTALILSGRRDEGKAELLAAFNDPTNPRPEFTSHNLGRAYFEEAKYGDAVNWFRTSLSRNRQNPDAAQGLAAALVALGRPEEAIGPLEAALKDFPGHLPLMVGLGEACYRAGRYAEARTRLEEAERRDPAGAAGRRAAELLKHLPR